MIAGPDLLSTEQTLNSFLTCCTDIPRVGRFLAVDAGLSGQDRAALVERYGFLEFVSCGESTAGAVLAGLREHVDSRFWLHLSRGWRFFAAERFITRLVGVLEAEAGVFQVAVNLGDAPHPVGSCAGHDVVRCTPGAGRYVLTDVTANGPAMFDTARMDLAGGLLGEDADPIEALGRRAAAAGLGVATLNEVLCLRETARRP